MGGHDSGACYVPQLGPTAALRRPRGACCGNLQNYGIYDCATAEKHGAVRIAT